MEEVAVQEKLPEGWTEGPLPVEDTITPSKPTARPAMTRKDILAQFIVGQKVVFNGIIFELRKVTNKDLVFRPVSN